MYAVLDTLQLTVHPDKRCIGKTEKGFDFLGYRFRPQKLLEPAVQSLTRLIERARRLHEKGADSHRLRKSVQRWVSWLHGGLQGAVTENRFNQIGNYVNIKLSGSTRIQLPIADQSVLSIFRGQAPTILFYRVPVGAGLVGGAGGLYILHLTPAT